MPVLMAILIGLSNHLLNRSLDAMRAVPHLADMLESEVDLLESAADEYFDTASARARQQSLDAFVRIRSQLARAGETFTSPPDQAVVDEVLVRVDQAKWSFDEYARLSRRPLNDVQLNYRRDIAERMRMELRSLVPLVNRLHHDAHLAMQSHSERGQWVEIAALSLVAVIVLTLMSPLLYRISSGLKTLQRGIDEMRGGGLSRDLELQGNDEFNQLAGQFNRMAHQLQMAEQEQERNLHALRTANHDLENFSYSVSHDLRSPLRAIDGFTAMLLEGHAQSLDSEGRRLFGIVQKNARKMGNLIDDILALSRAGRLELEPMDVRMEGLVDEVWHTLADHRGDRNIVFTRKTLPGAPCDPRAIRQVWQNLLDNAIKFTRDRDPAQIRVSGFEENGQVRYSVSDNGAGFNSDYSDKLFTLFQRLHGMDEFEGTGVGLAITKRLIVKHQGTVSAIAEVDGGATFSFTLPLHHTEQPRHEERR
jgi:light-regulated signal transduction histidine kinase (bacteriophytochrome)